MTDWLDLPWWERWWFVFRLWALRTFFCEHKWLWTETGGGYHHCPRCGEWQIERTSGPRMLTVAFIGATAFWVVVAAVLIAVL